MTIFVTEIPKKFKLVIFYSRELLGYCVSSCEVRIKNITNLYPLSNFPLHSLLLRVNQRPEITFRDKTEVFRGLSDKILR